MPKGQAPSPAKNNKRMAEEKKKYRDSAYGGPNEATAKKNMTNISRAQKGSSMLERVSNTVSPKLQKAKKALDKAAGNNLTPPRNQPLSKKPAKRKGM